VEGTRLVTLRSSRARSGEAGSNDCR